MKKLHIQGPVQLKGEIKVQGAKNAAIRHMLFPLLVNDIFIFHNTPKIGSIDKMLEIVQLQGGKTKWVGKNSVSIDTTGVQTSKPIPADVFFNTSGGVIVIPILASKYGKCIVEKEKERQDYGGDSLGSRKMETVIKTLTQIGITCKETNNEYIFTRINYKPFEYEVPVQSYTASTMALLSTLFCDGQSKISQVTTEPEFTDVITLCKTMGAQVSFPTTTKETDNANLLLIEGSHPLHGTEFTCMSDRHDFMTWVTAALVTDSQLTIQNVNYEKMKLDALEKVAKNMNIQLHFEGPSCFIESQLDKLKPTTIKAGRYPNFQTEWQVLISPLLTQLSGESKVIEMLYPNRMRHWDELKKMGATFEYYDSGVTPLFKSEPQKDKHLNSVIVHGKNSLSGTNVTAHDVRGGAALMIAALIAHGETVISRIEHIERGYEGVVERLKLIGGEVFIS